VLTDDEAVAQAAEQAGAHVRLQRPDPGLNPAIEAANAEAQADGCDASLVVLGDLPNLQPADVDAVVEAGTVHQVVIAPSSDGGTALLLRRAPDVIPARFGPESADAHARESRARGIEPCVLDSLDERARIDLDTPEDVERLLASGLASRTRDVLEKVRER